MSGTVKEKSGGRQSAEHAKAQAVVGRKRHDISGPVVFLAGLASAILPSLFVIGATLSYTLEVVKECNEDIRVMDVEKKKAISERDEAVKNMEQVHKLCGLAMAKVFDTETDIGFQKITQFEWGEYEGAKAEVLILKYDPPSPEIAAKNLEEVEAIKAVIAEREKYDKETGKLKEKKDE